MGFVSKIIKTVFRTAVYLALTGELVLCTMHMKQGAYDSVSTGLISLSSINNSFSGLRFK